MRGLLLGVLSAALFGAATPAGKVLLADFTPFQLAGLLYLGAALGVAPAVIREGRSPRALDPTNRLRLAGSVLFGGVAAPVLLLFALRLMQAGSVSLLLNLEMAATAVLAVALFGEHLGTRGWLGVTGVVVAGAVLSANGGEPGLRAGLLVAGACLCWGLDNNLTALVDGMTPERTTWWKGVIAGTTNLVIAVYLRDASWPASRVAVALAVGAVCYGASIALYVTAAHEAGATRTQAVFAAAPFIGAVLSWLVLGETPERSWLVGAGVLVPSVGLLAFDRHEHFHVHDAVAHVHSHRHDDGHHAHEHPGQPASVRHAHWHQHERVGHRHAHGSDLHHRHGR